MTAMNLVPAQRRYLIGIDLGKQRDHTAFVILERTLYRYPDTTVTTRHVRFIERVPLETPYPAIVERVRTMLAHPSLRGGNTGIVIDASGVGDVVLDLFRSARLDANIVGIVITAGEYDPRTSPRHVPRATLLANLQVMVQKQQIQIARGVPYREELQEELRHLRLSSRAQGHHDDLALALALAAWGSQRGF